MKRQLDEFDLQAEKEGSALRFAAMNRTNHQYRVSNKQRFIKTKHIGVTKDGQRKFDRLFR